MKNFKGAKIGIVIVLIGSLLFSCDTSSDIENPNDQLLKEITAIDQYLDQQGITAFEHFSGTRIHILKMGTGFPGGKYSTIDVTYTGKLFNGGNVFDSGIARGLLTSFIDGWKYAFSTLPAGTEAVLYIPSLYGYGKSGQGSIPADATLIFEVKFNEVVQTSQAVQQLKSDTTAIESYLEGKGIDAIKDTTGIRYVITQAGSGNTPDWLTKVKIKTSYRLISNDSEVLLTFEQEPNETTNNLVIDQISDGLKFALQKLRPGGKGTFYVPSGLGFGPQGAGNGSQILIQPNTNLILDVELISIVTP